MKKSLLIKFLMLVLVNCCMLLCISGCVNGQSPTGQPVDPPETHQCVFNQDVPRWDNLASEANCTESAKYYYWCKTCGNVGEETFEYGEPLGHEFGYYEYNHDAKCEVDGTKTGYCYYGCGKSETITAEDTALSHEYTNYVYNNDAKCEVDGTETATCDRNCGKSATRTKTGTALSHDYGEYISNNNDTHTQTCANDKSHTLTFECCGGMPTCTKKAICDNCKTEYGKLFPHKTEIISSVYHCKDCNFSSTFSTGLEYSVNEDNTTCTIISLGDCEDTVVYIPDYIDGYKVTVIGERTFAEQTNITFVEIPDTVEEIGNRAFYGCTGLSEITIPASVKNIGTQVFYKSAISFVYYNSTYSSQSNLFLNVESIKKVVFGGKGVPSSICKGNASVEEVIILNGNSRIGEYAFYDCVSLKTVTIYNNVTEIGDSSFENCATLNKVNYIGTIDEWAQIDFYNASSNPLYCGIYLYLNNELQTDIKINAETIKQYSFSGSTLASISFDNKVKIIEDYALASSLIQHINISNSVISIGNHAFANCSASTINIGNNVRTIGNGAFYECYNLTQIKLPNSITYLGDYAFSNCSNLVRIELSDNMDTIAYYTFEKCSSLKYVYLPDSIRYIEKKAFSHCESLENIIIPNSVTSIEEYAFEYCALTSIIIPHSVTSLGYEIFDYCYSLDIIYCEAEAPMLNWNEYWNNAHYNKSYPTFDRYIAVQYNYKPN